MHGLFVPHLLYLSECFDFYVREDSLRGKKKNKKNIIRSKNIKKKKEGYFYIKQLKKMTCKENEGVLTKYDDVTSY
jgi:hypothetical protein